MIFEVIGTPQASDLAHITDKRVLYYLQSFSSKPKKDLKTVFPAAPEEALDLLSKMVIFNPHQRITLEEALKHPFFDKVRTSAASEHVSHSLSSASTGAHTPTTLQQHKFHSPPLLSKSGMTMLKGMTSMKPELLEFDNGTELSKARLRELILNEISNYRQRGAKRSSKVSLVSFPNKLGQQ